MILLALLLVAESRRVSRLREYRANHPYSAHDVEAAKRRSKQQSQATITGRVQEHFAPLLREFTAEFNVRDARFLGSPIDFVVFDGLDAGRRVDQVVFVEIKTGTAGMTYREKLVRAAIEEGRVGWRTIKFPGVSTREPVEDHGFWTADSTGRWVRQDDPDDDPGETAGAGFSESES